MGTSWTLPSSHLRPPFLEVIKSWLCMWFQLLWTYKILDYPIMTPLGGATHVWALEVRVQEPEARGLHGCVGS